MIYTITLNPALDYVIFLDNFSLGDINRSQKDFIYYGGKGINVSLVLKQLHNPSIALGFIGGFSGLELQKGLHQQGLQTHFIEVANGKTRINVKIKAQEESEINGCGPIISDDDFNKLKQQLSHLTSDDIVIFSGSIPSCLPPDSYEKLIQVLPIHTPFVIDSSNQALLNTLKYHPFLIKPNHIELAQCFNTTITSESQLIYYGKKLQNLGAKNVLISRGKDGAILLDEKNQIYYQQAYQGKLVNSTGAGDSMLAGFIAGYLKYHDYKQALKLAGACGSACAFHLNLPTYEEILELYQDKL